MDRRGFLRSGGLVVAALAVPAIVSAQSSGVERTADGSETIEVTDAESYSVVEGSPVEYFGRPMVFFVETQGKGENRTRRVGARNLHGREATSERMEELVAAFCIAVKTETGTKVLNPSDGALLVADDTRSPEGIELCVQAPGEDLWFKAISA